MMQVTKVWWDGDKLMAEPIDPAAIYKEPEQPAQTELKQCWQCGDSDPAFQAKCDVPTCEMRAAPEQEPVGAECKFEGLGTWGRCSVEHHNLVQSEPHKWPDYQTRLLYTSPQPAQQEPVCGWQREDDDYIPDTWRSDCGVLWTFSDGSPVDNDMKYCCGCGAILLEKKT